MNFALQSFIFGLGGVLLAILGWNVLRARYHHPLSRVPGPLLARLTPYYLIFIDMAGNRSRHIHSLHQKYGPIVRIGPDEVSFTAPSVTRELYSQGTPYLKAPWYAYMSVPPVGVFAMRDPREHAARRGLFRHAFSQSAVNDTEPVIAMLIMKMLDILTTSENKPVDMLQLCRRLSLDISGQLFMGQSFQALESDKTPEFLEWMDNMLLGLGIKYAFPPISKVMSIMPLKGAQDILLAPSRIADYGAKVFYKYIEENGRRSTRRDLLTKILGANNEMEDAATEKGNDKSSALSDRVTYLEVGNLIFAGTDTTSSTLTYIFYELAQNPSWQDLLRDELRTHIPDDVSVPKYSSITDLPILDAIVNETLRLHPAAPASLPRSTPAGGRTLDGYFIPEGTVVSTQCYTTHRDPLAFPNPESWNPTRWLPSITKTENVNSAHVKDLFMPFSRGPRNCLGQYLAMVELKVTTATLVRSAKFRLAPETTKDSMEMIDHFLAAPKGGKCMLLVEAA